MKSSIITILPILLLPVVCVIGVYLAQEDNKDFTIRNNSTRDYQYEHYCDSIYEVNPDYYFDVLEETDEYQNYIDEHEEWWTN